MVSGEKLTTWITVPLIVAFAGVLLYGCTAKEVEQTLDETEKKYKEAREMALVLRGRYQHARKTYEQAKENYTRLRQKAIKLNEEGKIPEEVWSKAVELDRKLQELDARLVELDQKAEELWQKAKKVDSKAEELRELTGEAQVTYEKVLRVSRDIVKLGIVVAEKTA